MPSETPTIAATVPCKAILKAGEQYWYCTCGQSKKQPFCDGSHAGTPFRPHGFTADKDGDKWLCQCKHTGTKPFCDGTHKTLKKPEGGCGTGCGCK